MAGNKKLPLLKVGYGIYPCLIIGLCQDSQLLHLFYVLLANLRMPGMRHIELIIKAPEQRLILLAEMMPVHAEYLRRHIILRYAVMIVQPRLSSPADMEGGVHMALAPLHDFRNFLPVGHVLKRHLLHRRTGNDKAIVFLVAHLGKGAIELRQVILGGVRRHIGLGIDKIHLHLQRRIAQEPQQLGFRHLLDGHQVQNQKPQRTNILAVGPVRIHNKNMFFFQNCRCRQIIWYLDWH